MHLYLDHLVLVQHIFLELVNSTHRTLLSGVAYQLGNLVSSASATIEAKIGERFPLKDQPGMFDYGKVMCIFVGQFSLI